MTTYAAMIVMMMMMIIIIIIIMIIITNYMAYGTRRFNAAFTKALQ